MAKKTVGYIDLEWTCPSCGARNPGTVKSCKQCGTAMPQDMEFELPAEQKLDTSAETAARVAAGPDIHCPFCGARNRGDASVCVQCGGDLSQGARRAEGKVLGALQTGPAPEIICPHCGQKNPATQVKCSSCGGTLPKPKAETAAAQAAPKKKSPLLWIILALVALLGCWLIATLSRGSRETEAVVKDVQWSYIVQIEELKPVAYEDWRDQVPVGAKLGYCSRKVRRTLPEPVAGATEVCGTPYVEDTGTGKGKVVQDCVYQVTDEWCQYTVEEWRPATQEVASGRDFSPGWPAVRLGAAQREGSHTEEYQVELDADGKPMVYHPHDLAEFRQFTIGSSWTVTTNALGGVTSVQPK